MVQSAAVTAKAKLAGKWVERSEQTTKTDDLNTLSDAQLAASRIDQHD